MINNNYLIQEIKETFDSILFLQFVKKRLIYLPNFENFISTTIFIKLRSSVYFPITLKYCQSRNLITLIRVDPV